MYKIGDRIGGIYVIYHILGGEGKSGMGVVTGLGNWTIVFL